MRECRLFEPQERHFRLKNAAFSLTYGLLLLHTSIAGRANALAYKRLRLHTRDRRISVSLPFVSEKRRRGTPFKIKM